MKISDIDRIEIVGGYPVSIKNPPDDLTEEELQAYVDRGTRWHPQTLRGLELEFDGDEVGIYYIVDARPFQRVRRITGYLVGDMTRWNDAKTAEEADRVKHGTE